MPLTTILLVFIDNTVTGGSANDIDVMYQAILNEKRRRVRGLPDLPPFPAIGQQILSQVTSEQVDIPRLSKTIERDPAVFARIIGVANSAYYGCTDKIYTINHAIVRVLGLNVVKSLALGIVLNEPFRQTLCQGFDIKRHWFMSLYTAMLAQTISRHVRYKDKSLMDQAYLAGMLNNLGDLVLAYLFPSEMSDVLTRSMQEPDVDVKALQLETVGLTSQEACSILAKKWHLPTSLRAVFQFRDVPDYEGPYATLTQLMRLSHLLASEGDVHEMTATDEMNALSTHLGLGQLDNMMKKLAPLHQEVSQLAGALNGT